MFVLRGVISIAALFLASAKAITINTTLGHGLVGEAFNPGPADITIASWMWTTSAGITNVPAGTSAFRLTFHPSPVFPLANITIAITTDNAYNLYFNNTLVGSSIDWPTPNVWTILNVPSNGPWIFAVLATNFQQTTINPAGVIASFRASNDAQQAFYNWWTGQIASPSVVWKAMSQAPNDFAQPSLNDSTWPSAVILTPYGGGQWGFLPAPVAKTLCG